MFLDILVFAPHPDDAEMCCGGLLLLAKKAGLRVGIVEVTRGESSTRGSAERRKLETEAASALLGADARENLCLPDAHLMDNQELRTALTRTLRRYRPTALCLPHWEDQHPDHAAVGQAGIYAAWLCGAVKFDPESADGIAADDRPPYRPKRLLHYQNRYGVQPDLVLDVSSVIEQKMALVACFASQFNFPGTQNVGEPQTMLSSRDFEAWFRGSHAAIGAKIRVAYGEAYCLKTPVPIHDVKALAL